MFLPGISRGNLIFSAEAPGEEPGEIYFFCGIPGEYPEGNFFLRKLPGMARGIPGNPVRPHRRWTGEKRAEKFFYGVAREVIARGTVGGQYPDSFSGVPPGKPPGPGMEERGIGEIRP